MVGDVLVVIEAPGKRAAIAKALQLPLAQIFATRGHFRRHPGWHPVGITAGFDEYGLLFDEVIKRDLLAQVASLAPQEVIVATDADTEGDVIGRDVYECLRLHCADFHKLVVTRWALGCLNGDDIRNAVVERQPFSDHEGILAGDVRRVVDRAIPLCFGDRERRGVVGRVRSVVIANAVTTPMSVRWADVTLRGESGWSASLHAPVTAAQIDALRFSSKLDMANVLVESASRSALPNTMDVLQASPEFGLTPTGTMAVLQRLYETGLLSYPRTRSRALSAQTLAWASRQTHLPDEAVVRRRVATETPDGAHGGLTPLLGENFSRTKALNGGNIDAAVLAWIGRAVLDAVAPAPMSLRVDQLPVELHRLPWRVTHASIYETNKVTLRALSQEMQVLGLLQTLNVGRPSTYATHARTIAELGLVDGNGVTAYGKRIAALVPALLVDGKLCRAIDHLENVPHAEHSLSEAVEKLLLENLPLDAVHRMKTMLAHEVDDSTLQLEGIA